MKSIKLITDSNSSILLDEAERLGIDILPMPFYIDGECYYEDYTLSREEFFKKLENGAEVSTSQPSPKEVLYFWDRALADYDEVIYMPMSSGLSGSCMTAAALAQDEPYENRVFVVDNGRISTPLYRSILDALALIEEGYDGASIKQMLEASREDMNIYIAVDTLKYLKKGGRITPAAAAIGTVLNIKPVLRLGTGNLDVYRKCRGSVPARKAMINAMKQDLETRFKPWLDRGEVTMLAASSASPEEAAAWTEQIREAFPGMEVMYSDLALSVCCHIGRGGLGIGCSCRPARI